MSAPLVLADVNVWLASVFTGHVHHRSATRWWSEDVIPSGARVAFCRMTQLGLLRLLTNEAVMGDEKQSVKEAWDAYRQILQQGPVTFVAEPAGLEEGLAALCHGRRSSKHFWTDAYLAAFATAASMRLATFDRGFRKFSGLQLTLLA